jgi:hypothetical protein
MAGSVVTAIALILLFLFVLVAFYFILFKRNKGFNYADLPIKPCTYDADCRIASGDSKGTAIVERCVIAAGNETGTCSAYCLLNSDCTAGNPGGSTTCQQDSYGRFLCTLAAATGTACTTPGEVPVTIPTGPNNTTNDTSSYCLILGLSGSTAEPRLCGSQNPWGTNLYCTFATPPNGFNQECYWDKDCQGGFSCSNGCTLANAGGTSGCDGKTPGYCVPPSNPPVGYVSQCNTANPCPSGTCTSGLCTSGSPTVAARSTGNQLPVIRR